MKRPKPLSLSKAFNDLSHHPARRFELKNKLRGIAGHYKIPGGVTALAYENATVNRMWREAGKDFWTLLKTMTSPPWLLKSWNKMAALNPDLEKLRVNKNSATDLFHALIGATSGFNVDDIAFYIEQLHQGGGLPYHQARTMPGHGERLARIDSVSEGQARWVLSPKTAQRIERCFKRRKIL